MHTTLLSQPEANQKLTFKASTLQLRMQYAVDTSSVNTQEHVN